VVVRRSADGRTTDITPPGFNARTRVHEYGGGAYLVDRGTVYFANFDDQRLFRQDAGGAPWPITPPLPLRYGDGVVDRARGRIICVREDHRGSDQQAVATIVAVDTAGSAEQQVLVSGRDFYSNPRLSSDGRRLVWLAWSHPNMPWDGTELWVGELDDRGTLGQARQIAGGATESIFQPEWSPDGTLIFVSDRTGFWNLHRWRGSSVEPVTRLEAEFAGPQWLLGMTTYAIESADRLVCRIVENGRQRLALVSPATGEATSLRTPYDEFGANLRAASGVAIVTAGSPTQLPALVRIGLSTGQAEVLRRSSPITIDPGFVSTGEPIEFETTSGQMAHAFFYRPANKDFQAPEGERPPLLVHVHGGPTAMVGRALDLEVQYWTSRGFASVDVNYGGSTGFGRAYRERLNGQWGVVDVDDAVSAAQYLVAQGLVDGHRLAITGGSAGGYTVLCALTFRNVFQAGASHFGISDLEVFAGDTHKFESRYLERLVGPYPDRRDLYAERSAINATDRISAPVILFQGLEDKIVPPNQAELIVEALRKKGLPVAYLPFEGEQHGFRRAENIRRAVDGEFYFYSRIFGFQPADRLEPVQIDNL
jgi:dipeptidyl aminopeptidase/acylaminoacyl peptidase